MQKVPMRGPREGSFGTESTGPERPRGAALCAPQMIDPCRQDLLVGDAYAGDFLLLVEHGDHV